MARQHHQLQGFVSVVERHAFLSEEDRDAILSLPFTVNTLDPMQYMLREGDRPTHCTLLLKGSAFRQKIMADGGRQIISFHFEGELIDLQNILLQVADHNVQALTRVDLAQIPYERVVDLAFTRPTIGRALWMETMVEGSILREWIANVGRRDARSRTAHVLCEIAIRREAAGVGRKEEYELPMTQEQLADMVGLTAVHVNRTLRSLQEEGLIVRHKRAVQIEDWDGLRAAADFRTLFLHLGERLPEDGRTTPIRQPS